MQMRLIHAEREAGFEFAWSAAGAGVRTGNVLAAAVAVGQQADILAALGGRLVWRWRGVHRLGPVEERRVVRNSNPSLQ